jgi:flagellar hook-associated protein 3 FlgL
MRVTDSSAYATIRKQVLRARQDFSLAQEQAGSGLRVQKPSDDPVAAASARREYSRKALAEAGTKATESATTELEGADFALSDVYDGVTRAREFALSGSSSSSSDENRRSAAVEVRKIQEQMVTLGNTNVAGRYVFAGYRDHTAPYTEAGEFVGDDSTKEVQALPGLRVAGSITGKAIFGNDSINANGQADDLFSTLDRLATALESNDTDAVRSTFDDLTTNEDRVLGARSQVGSMINSVSMAQAVAENHFVRAGQEIGRLVEVDEITAATNLSQAKNALESALTIAQQMQVGTLAGGR